MRDIANAQSYQVTAAQLAVDAEIEQSEIAHTSGELKPDADLPDLLEREGALLAG
nr:hypothetical protein [Thiocapsa sp.]